MGGDDCRHRAEHVARASHGVMCGESGVSHGGDGRHRVEHVVRAGHGVMCGESEGESGGESG